MRVFDGSRFRLNERPRFIGGGWTPFALGSSLLAWWDAERPDLMTDDGAGVISSWRDVVGGYDATAATTARPTWSATGFNGRPVVTADGVANAMTLTGVPAGIPTGADGCIIFAVVDQTALTADATVRTLIQWGSGVTLTARGILRLVSTVGRVRVQCGDNAVSQSSTLNTVEFIGRKSLLGTIDGANISVTMDGATSTPTGCVPATTTTRLRLFAGSNTAASGFWQGGINTVGILSPNTSAGDLALLAAYLTRRL